MNIDKKFLKSLLLDSKDNAYLYDLYKIYDLCSQATNNNIFKGRKILDAFEDKIYTIKGKTLSQKERILLELNKIIESISKNHSSDLNSVVEGELLDLITLIDKSSLDSAQQRKYDSIKEKIVVIEARLHLPISFLYSGAITFLNKYESAYINNRFSKYYSSINKEYNDYKEIIKKEEINKYIKGDK